MSANPPPSLSGLDDAHAVHRINMSWLVRLRWWTIAGQAAVIGVVEWGLRIGLPLPALSVILAAEIAFNVAVAAWLARKPPVSERRIAAALAADVLCFTGLLYFTGGPLNPFSFLYLVYIALAALVLSQRWSWALVVLSAAASAALFVANVPLPMGHEHLHHGHGEPLGMHLRGMWVAFAVAAAFIVYFIHRVTRALSEREAELSRARDLSLRTERLASMATLAAGAAHELATPLSTVAVVARELERRGTSEVVTADARLIREQVERCRGILAQMASGAGESPGEAIEEASLESLVSLSLEGLPEPDRVSVEWGEGLRAARVTLPQRAIAQALRNVLRNALDASPADRGVSLRVEAEGEAVRFLVEDQGAGMSRDVLAHVTEPFFTTKPPGAGMGLGLFLTRTVVERLGGALDIESELGKGSRVAFTLPSGGAAKGRIAPAERK